MKTGRLLAAGLLEKLKESLISVLPTIILVLALSFTVAPISSSILLCFLMGGALLILGMMFFTLGAELAMTPMGSRNTCRRSRCLSFRSSCFSLCFRSWY